MDPNAVQKVSPRFQYPPSIRRARWRSSLSDSLLVRSFSDGGSGLDSESAPSRTLAPHSPSEREREGGRERRKQAVSPPSALLSVPAERLGILCFTSIFVCSWARKIEEGRRDVILTDFISEFCIWGNAFVSQVHGLPLRMSASVRPQKTFRLTH